MFAEYVTAIGFENMIKEMILKKYYCIIEC